MTVLEPRAAERLACLALKDGTVATEGEEMIMRKSGGKGMEKENGRMGE